MSIPISIIVCTRNRVDSLRRCVQTLASIKSSYEWELVIVDNGSNDGTRAFLASLPRQLNYANVLTTCEPRRGLSAARNKGVSQAHGDIVAFTGDDCYVTENYVDAMISAFAVRSEIGFVGGRILLYDKSDVKFTVLEREDYLILQPRTFLASGTIQGANMAFRKKVICEIGGFDENLGAGTSFACEDVDAGAAALWAGVMGAYDPNPTVYHHHGRKTKGELRDLRKAYDKGRGAYFAKYILQSDSGSEYLRQWMRHIIGGVSSGSFRGRLWASRRSFRELSGGLHYVIARLRKQFER
jgi:GT2 family glycosyltransferase